MPSCHVQLGLGQSPQKLGSFREFLSVMLLLTVSFRINWGSRMYHLLSNNFVEGATAPPVPAPMYFIIIY